MTLRRDFLKVAAAMAAGGTAFAQKGKRVHLGCQTNAWPINPRDFSTFLAVLQKVKGYGYDGFETAFANVQGQFDNATEAKAKIDAYKLQFFGVHIFLRQYDKETHVASAEMYERIAAGGAKLGAQRLILSGSPAPDDAERRKKADGLNRAGAFAAKLGMGLAYHNHGPEFQNNGAEIEYLIRETNPAHVSFLLDAGHAFRAGADIPAFVRKHYQRLAGMHLRDTKDGKEAPLGTGDFPLQALAVAIRETGWKGWLINEEERVGGRPGDEAIKPARDALFRVFGGKS